MTPVEVIDISRDALWVLIKIAAPLMLIALSVGLMISLFQALTQIQEMTLSFVPKILAMFFAMITFMPFMLTQLTDFHEELTERIIMVGQSNQQ